MNLRIYKTEDGICTYPLHVHSQYEIIYYLKGTGVLRTETHDYPFVPGTVIIVPPGIYHGSTSSAEFKNISINGDFESFFSFKEITVIEKTGSEGIFFAEHLYRNRHENSEYIHSLCNTYILYLLRYAPDKNTTMEICINKIISEASQNAFDPDYSITKQLAKSGYAEDYIRQQFKIRTGKTPIEFVNGIRIKRSCYLIDIYAKSYSLAEISQKCGFFDYSYFLKCFKKHMGISPKEYKEHRYSN